MKLAGVVVRVQYLTTSSTVKVNILQGQQRFYVRLDILGLRSLISLVFYIGIPYLGVYRTARG